MKLKGWGRLAALSPVLLGACSVVGCDSGRGSKTETPWFVGEYVEPSEPGGALRLSISADGTFLLARCGLDHRPADHAIEEIARGRWSSLGDGVRLEADGWTAALMTDDVSVSLPSRTDTLSGLSCSRASDGAPIGSARFVRQDEFADFVRPPGGSGTSTSGL